MNTLPEVHVRQGETFAAIRWFEEHLTSGRMEWDGGAYAGVGGSTLPAPVSLLQLGLADRAEGKPAGRGDSQETLQLGIPQSGNRTGKRESWETASNWCGDNRGRW